MSTAYELTFGEPPPMGRCTTSHVLVMTLDSSGDLTIPVCRDCGIRGWAGHHGEFWTVAASSTPTGGDDAR